MKYQAGMVSVVVAILLAAGAFAGDWPQWMGANRNGVVEKSPPLLDSFAEGEPKVLWTSEQIIGGWSGGWGTVAVAGGRAYVFSSHNFDVPITERVVTKRTLQAVGADRKLPDDLRKKVEAARTSEEREKLKGGREIDIWIKAWLKKNITKKTRRYQGAVQKRLQAGRNGPSPEQLAKLRGIRKRKFENQAALDAWFAENGISDPARKYVLRSVAKKKRQAKDYLFSLDVSDGKTAWKKEMPGTAMSYPNSTTPCVVDGRVYHYSSDGFVYCFDAKTGTDLWKTETPKKRRWTRTRSSSVLVVDGVAVVITEAAGLALDAKDGSKIWENKRLGNEGSSAAAWRSEGKTYIIVNGGRKLNLVELKTGKVLWTTRGGVDGSAVVADGVIAFAGGAKVGLKTFDATTDEAKERWQVSFADDYASPVIYQGHVYAIGGTPKGSEALCVELKTGKVVWRQKMPKDAVYGSPVVADGKLIVVAGKDLYLIKATPEKYTLLGKANMRLEKWTSATFSDGRIFLRRGKSIICCDLRK